MLYQKCNFKLIYLNSYHDEEVDGDSQNPQDVVEAQVGQELCPLPVEGWQRAVADVDVVRVNSEDNVEDELRAPAEQDDPKVNKLSPEFVVEGRRVLESEDEDVP